MRRGLALALLFLLGCSRSPVMDHEQLASERKQLHSLDAETALLDRIIATKHATPTFVHAHAEYLRRASHELAQQLGKARRDVARERRTPTEDRADHGTSHVSPSASTHMRRPSLFTTIVPSTSVRYARAPCAASPRITSGLG